MRADEALKQSRDGRIWLNGKSAQLYDRYLMWNGEIRYVVLFSEVISDQWQPAEPTKEKCEACKEYETISHNSCSPNSNHILLSYCLHLKQYHCTCGGIKR